jgi:hypothetical protein
MSECSRHPLARYIDLLHMQSQTNPGVTHKAYTTVINLMLLLSPIPDTFKPSINFRQIRANVGTEGANENFSVQDVFGKLRLSQPVLHRFECNLSRYVGLIHAELVTERSL